MEPADVRLHSNRTARKRRTEWRSRCGHGTARLWLGELEAGRCPHAETGPNELLVKVSTVSLNFRDKAIVHVLLACFIAAAILAFLSRRTVRFS